MHRKQNPMKTVYAILLGLMITTGAASAYAQDFSGSTASLAGRSYAAEQNQKVQGPTPLFVAGNMAFGIWARVAPPYDGTANRNFAANPLW